MSQDPLLPVIIPTITTQKDDETRDIEKNYDSAEQGMDDGNEDLSEAYHQSSSCDCCTILLMVVAVSLLLTVITMIILINVLREDSY